MERVARRKRRTCGWLASMRVKLSRDARASFLVRLRLPETGASLGI